MFLEKTKKETKISLWFARSSHRYGFYMWTLCLLIFFYFNYLSFERERKRERERERKRERKRECVKNINETKNKK